MRRHHVLASPARARDPQSRDGQLDPRFVGRSAAVSFAASNARSMPSMSRARRMRPDSASRCSASSSVARPAKARQRRHRVVDLRERAVRAGCSGRAGSSSGSRCIGSTQAEQRAFRIGVRHDGARARSRSPGCERRRRWRASSADVDPRDLRAGSNLDAGLPRRGRTSASARTPGPPATNQPLRDRMTFAGAEQSAARRGAARGPRSEERSEDAAGGDGRRAAARSRTTRCAQVREPPSASTAAAGSASALPSARNARPVFSSSMTGRRRRDCRSRAAALDADRAQHRR